MRIRNVYTSCKCVYKTYTNRAECDIIKLRENVEFKRTKARNRKEGGKI